MTTRFVRLYFGSRRSPIVVAPGLAVGTGGRVATGPTHSRIVLVLRRLRSRWRECTAARLDAAHQLLTPVDVGGFFLWLLGRGSRGGKPAGTALLGGRGMVRRRRLRDRHRLRRRPGALPAWCFAGALTLRLLRSLGAARLGCAAIRRVLRRLATL
ncbi:MAG: hypothetical protein AAF615_00535 [Pseudomonadota bacterium]